MSVDRGAIDAQLREIGEGERWWEQREFRELPYILHPDERIAGLTVGKLMGRRRPRLPGPRWLFVATNQRLICLQQERFGRKEIDINLGQISGIDHRTGLRAYRIRIETAHRTYRLHIPKTDAFRFIGALAPLFPRPAQRAVDPTIAALSWIPGMGTVAGLPGVSGLVSKISLLSPPDYASHEHVARLEARVEQLSDEVDRLQQQVEFLEKLLLERTTETLSLPGPSRRASRRGGETAEDDERPSFA